MTSDERYVRKFFDCVVDSIKNGVSSKKIKDVQYAYDDRRWLDSDTPHHFLIDLKTGKIRKCLSLVPFINICRGYGADHFVLRASMEEAHNLPTQNEILRHYQGLTN